MSRAINTSLATIQFQVNARQANAAMQALQNKADELNDDIASVNKNIKNLGEGVPKDNPDLLNYQNQLKALDSQLKDVQKAQRDFLKGAKAADQLWKAAGEGSIESLSFRSIKAGINGLKKRQEGLSPGDAQDMKDWRIIKEVIDEADRVMKQAGADVQNVVQTIREGGKVSEQTMRQTINTLKELKGSVDETDADFRTYGNDLDFMEAKLQEFNEAQRRAKGEIVDANDARREMNKLTEEGAAAAKREAEEAEQLVASLKQESEELVRKRGEIKQNIEDTQKQIDENHKLIEEKHRQLAADEETFNAEQEGRRTTIDGLKTQAEAERKLANEKSDAAETHRRAAELQAQTTEQLTEKVTELQGKLAALNAEPVKPKADTSEIERIERHLKNIANLRKPQQEIIDAYEAKYGKTRGEQYEAHRKIELEASLKDVAAQEAAVEKVNKKWDDFWKKQEAAAQEFARSLGKSLDEIAPEDITSEQLSGPLAKSAQAAYKVTARRDYEFSEALGREGKLTEYKETARRYEGDDSPEAKVIESLTRKYREYVKELNEATTSDAEAKKVRAELREESDAYISALGQMKGFQEAENNLLQKKEGLLKQSAQKSEQQIQLEGQLADAKEQLRLAQEKQNDEQQEYVKLQGEAIEQGNKAAAAETKLADAQSEATQKQADFNQKQQEGLDNINQMAQGNQALQQSIDGLNGELEQNSKDIADNANKATETEQQKQQARQLSIKRMEEMLAKLKEEYYTEELTAEKREEHKQKIKELDEALKLAKGEWMSYADAMKYANSIGSEGFMATDEQTKMATDALTRHREELIKTIQQKEADSQATSAERAELEQLDQALTKIKTGFTGADDVMTRWAEHMNAGKTASEGMAQTLDEKLAGATSSFDNEIEDAIKDIADYDEELKKAETRLADLEQQMEQATNKAKNRSGIGRALFGDSDRKKIYDLQLKLEGDEDRWGAREYVEDMKRWKQDAQDRLDRLKQQKAEELGLAESEVRGEEKKADAKRLTNEQMQQGIKLLEEEYAKTDHTTEEGIKKREQLREAIDQMNQELKESTGEWMKLADAEKLAEQAGKDTFLNKEGKGFIASPEEIQKATQALERRRDALIKNMKTSGEATNEQERELADLTKKIKDLKFEQDNLNMSQEKMQMLMRTPTNAVSLDELRAAIKRADGELKRMEGSLGQNNKQYQEFAAQVRNAKNLLKEMEGQAKASATAWEKAWSRLKTYVVMYMGFNAVWQKMVGTADDLMQLSDKMGEVRKTTGFTADEVGRLSDNLAKLDTRTSLTGLMEFGSLAGSIGMKTQEQVQGFTEAANMLAVSLPEMGNEASRTLIKIADATGDLEKNGGNVRETLERVGSTIIALRANSAAAAGPITDFVSRVGAVGAQAGISIDQIAALGATVDALGGRVEMSATALSRMIPAIRNNTFEVAKAIGMTEKELKGMTGMEQMVAIFRKLHDSAKGFDTSTEDGMNAMADSVEKALGRSTSMQEVMKELNQQGARAGIVFGLLSQNVDKLEEQLDTASNAYSKNVALMNEYNKMNDTTAAKWEKLKNQLEEFIVGDSMQRFIGNIIDGLRKIVDLLTSNSGLGSFMRYSIVYFILLKAKWAEAFGTMLMSLGKFIWSMRESAIVAEADAAAKSADAAATTALGNATVATTEKTNLFSKAWGKLNAAMKANVIAAIATALVWLGSTLWDSAKAAKEAAEAINRVKEKTEEERDAVNSLFNPLKKANLEEAEKKRLINEINSKYGSYLSKMLTEASNAQEIARAYEAINLQLERKNTLEGINANKKKVMEDNKGVLDSAFNEMDNAVQKAFYGKKGTDASRISSFISGAVSDAIAQGLSGDQLARQVETALRKEVRAGKMKEFVQIMSGGTSRREDASSYIVNAAKRYYNTQMQVQGEVTKVNKRLQSDLDHTIEKVREAADKDIPELVKSLSDALSKGTDVKKYSSKESGAVVEAFNAIKSYYDLHREDLSDEQKNKLLKAMGTDITAFQTKANAGGGGGGSNPYGDYNKVTSPYSQWNGDDLVARRKEMLERVRALANGADVQKVLSEDAKFISDAVRKNIKTTEQAIEWYNTERLKIQEALHAKHLTNTGDWMDPKQQKIRKKLMQDDMKAYLEELDAYYTERKTEIDRARNDEEISEAEAWNRNIKNEAEWHKRRAELQIMYSNKHKQIAEDEQDAISAIIAERTGDDAKYIKATISNTRKFSEAVKAMNDQGAKEYRKFQGDLDLGSEKDWNKVEKALTQHLKAIEEIVNKERPFNGIAKNMQDNLGKMGILTADLTEGADSAAEELKRITFLLGESENAYTMTVEKLLDDMRQNGFKEWADVISKDPSMQQGLLAMLRQTFDSVQDAIKKESSIIKKQVEIMMQDITEQVQADTTRLQILQNSVSRANSLIGAGPASERVADNLAIKQMQLQITMAETRIRMLQKRGADAVAQLKQEANLLEKQDKMEEAKQKRMDAQNVEKSVGLTLTKEQVELDKQRVSLAEKLEESQNRLYTELKAWADLLASSLQSVMEASNAGNAEYYNELAKLNLTGKGGPGAGTYIVIDNEGTEDATAHYEYLDERQALERQHEIERENAQAEAWKKVMDDINMKLSETITDQLNAMMQNASVDMNTDATRLNTDALGKLTERLAQGIEVKNGGGTSGTGKTDGTGNNDVTGSDVSDFVNGKQNLAGGVTPETLPSGGTDAVSDFATGRMMYYQQVSAAAQQAAQAEIDASNQVRDTIINNTQQQTQSTLQSDKKMAAGTQSMFAKMTSAANLYGIAYQAMSNENLSTSQKMQLIAVQAAGQAAISSLTATLAETTAETTTRTPSVFAWLWSKLGPAAIPVFAIFTGGLGALMGLATAKITKSKSQIAQATGASVGAGRLATGMLTYASGNINELSDPTSLTVGRSYNVDGADGKTYRAKYTGKDAKTHITNGPEFHLVGEAGREAIIDAHTTQLIRMNDTGIWRDIQTLYNGGSLSTVTRRRRGKGMRAFADGNLDDFEEVDNGSGFTVQDSGFNPEMLAGFQSSLDRNNELLERALTQGIKGVFNVYGKGGLVDSYDTGKKTVNRHGERY